MKLRFSPFLSLIISLAAPLPQLVTAAPLVSIGDNADIFFNGSSSLQWSSNIFRDEDDEVDDFWWTVTPGFEFNLGRGLSNLDLSVITRYEIRRYFDLDDLNTELFDIEAKGTYRSSRLDLSGSAYFREQKNNTGNENVNSDLVESYKAGGLINAEYRMSPKFSFGAGISYDETEFKAPFNSLLSDNDRFNLPLDIFYELTPKVDLSLGYTYSESDVSDREVTPADDSYTTERHFINVGARGNLLPKLSGFFKIGYSAREDDRAGSPSGNTLGLDSDLNWTVTPKFALGLGASRDYSVSGEGLSTEDTSVSLTSNYSINSYFAATAFVNYLHKEYNNGQDDNQYFLGARITYTPSDYWRFGAGYTFSENDSDLVDRSFTDHTIDFTVTLRY